MKLTSNATMMADMQATRRRWEELNTERKEAMSHVASLKNHRRFRPFFPYSLMQWAAPEYRSEQENPVSASKWKNYDSITGRWEKQTFPRVRCTKNSGSGGIRPCSSEPSCLNVKRNYAPEAKTGKDTERSRAEQLRKMTMPLWIQGC
ncbi:hypothetical protein [Escherichia coli]